MENKTTIFTVDNKRVSLELDTSRGYLSLCGTYDGGSGQIYDRLPDLSNDAHEYAEELAQVKSYWRQFHLKQLELIPDNVLTDLELDFTLLNGERFWVSETPPVDDPGNAKFDQFDDIINSSDVMERIETLKACENLSEEHKQELRELEELESYASGYAPDWKYGETLIRDSYFQEYAEELAESYGMVDSAASWPNNCIDWERAARQLQTDYTAVEFRGVTFWIR